MLHLQLTTLEKDGWELLENQSPLTPNIGQLIKLTIAVVSPLDFDKIEIRSVSHHDLWAEITEIKDDGFIGTLKSALEHEIPLKDGSSFNLGDQIYFEARHIQTTRTISSQNQSPSA